MTKKCSNNNEKSSFNYPGRYNRHVAYFLVKASAMAYVIQVWLGLGVTERAYGFVSGLYFSVMAIIVMLVLVDEIRDSEHYRTDPFVAPTLGMWLFFLGPRFSDNLLIFYGQLPYQIVNFLL